MSRFLIKGGKPLTGELTPVGNKNAALPMIAASLLTSEPVTLTNLPLIEDVRIMLDLLVDLGVDVVLKGRTATLCAADIQKTRLNAELCHRVRSSILIAGPLLARLGKATLHPPGGDIIGRRRLDTHLLALTALGARVSGTRTFTFSARTLKGADILLDEASVTATENTMMAAALADGKTTLFNAACEPHIQDLGQLLKKMGARIRGLGTNLIEIKGARALRGASHRIGPDYIEAGSLIAAAAATGGALKIKSAPNDRCMTVLQRGFGKLGVNWRRTGREIVLPARQTLEVVPDFADRMPKIEDGVWPAFPSDLMSVAIVLATQTSGSMLFFEKLFESRMYFVDELIAMGARIVQCDPHRVVVAGPTQLHGSQLTSPDIRAGMALIVAALCAKGESVIQNAQIVDRGYERIEDRLRSLGADIERVD